MHKLTEAAGRVIADEVHRSLSDTDQALLSGSRLSASVLEASIDANLHPRTKQKLLESMASGFSLIVQGRRAIVEGHSQMIVIQRHSNIAEVDYGCVGGPEEERRGGFFTTAQSGVEASGEKAGTSAA